MGVTPFLDRPAFKLTHGQRWVFYGRSGTGKTYTAVQVLSLFTKLRPKPTVILISPNAASDKTWKEAVSSWATKSRGRLVTKYFQTLSPDVASYITRLITRRKRSNKGKPYLFMVDDLGEDHTINRTWINNPIRELAISSRHLKMSIMMLYQSVAETLRPLATNADVIVAKEMGGVERELLRKMYLEDYSKEEFRNVCDEAWREPYDTLVIDRTATPRVRLWRNFEEPIEFKEDLSEVLTHFIE